MVRLACDPAVNVTQSCVRRRFRYASCRACVDICPAQAFSVSDRLELDPRRCLSCGDCLFVCPAGAIDGVTPVRRFLRDDTLVGPFSIRAPTVEELLLWHSQYGVRYVALDPEQSMEWMIAIASLNLRLREYGEPEWALVPPASTAINASRRALFHVPREEVRACRVEPGKGRVRQAFAHLAEVEITLDEARCQMCGACWRACPEQAIRFNAQELAIEPARCTGCGGCTAVCGHQALQLEARIAPARIVTFTAYTQSCTACQRPFWSLDPQTTRCVLCQKHQHGMRL